MSIRTIAVAVALLGSVGWWITTPSAEHPYVGDPDESRPTLHVQPPALTPVERSLAPQATASVINGITYIDVLVSAGYDVSGGDYGNEPAITANPLNPNQIVLTSFSGSDWPTGGNASFFYSGNGGASWSYTLAVPPPPGTTTTSYCPCDQNMDWARNGLLYGTFLHYDTSGTVATVFSAQAGNPVNSASWTYRAPGGVAQSTSAPAYVDSDQPWLWSGPLPGDNSQTNVCVAYDVFDPSYNNSEIHAADSPGASPLDFTREAATNDDGSVYSDGMNPGNRLAVGPDGKIFNVFQRLVSVQANGVKQVTYLITVSTDGGLTWQVGNSDHPSLAKIVAANVYSFQGNGSKVGGVNALLGGVDAMTADPTTGAAWVVYGTRATLTGHDQLYLVKVTYSSGNLTVGTPVLLTSSAVDNYLPSVAVLPNGEVGVLFLTLSGTTFQWRFVQYTNGITIAKTTGFPTFTSPFASTMQSNQRIFGDYVQVRAVGCTFYGTYPARGSGASSVNSIDPYFMSAPSANACSLNSLTNLVPGAACAGSAGLSLAVQGTGFANGATGRVQGVLRPTTYNTPTQVTMSVAAADLAVPGTASIELIGALPAGGLSGSLPLAIETPAASPGNSLAANPNGSNVALGWAASAGATSYRIKRCTSTSGPCVPAPIATAPTNSYPDGVRLDGDSYWYLVDAVNSCGATP